MCLRLGLMLSITIYRELLLCIIERCGTICLASWFGTEVMMMAKRVKRDASRSIKELASQGVGAYVSGPWRWRRGDWVRNIPAGVQVGERGGNV